MPRYRRGDPNSVFRSFPKRRPVVVYFDPWEMKIIDMLGYDDRHGRSATVRRLIRESGEQVFGKRAILDLIRTTKTFPLNPIWTQRTDLIKKYLSETEGNHGAESPDGQPH